MNIKHIIFFDIKIETKQKKKNLKKEREVESKRKNNIENKKSPHIQMITTDATVSKMEKMKKVMKGKKPLKNHKKTAKQI